MKIKRFNDLNESYDNNEMTTEIDKSDVYINDNILSIVDKSLKDKQIDYIDINTCKVYWIVNIDINNRGIDGFIPSIKSIKINADVTIFKEYDSDETYTETMDFIFDDENSEFIIDDKKYVDDYEKQTLPYSPNEINIIQSHDKFIVTVNF